MKKLLSLSILLFVIEILYSQVPQKMSYQAIIRDNTNTLIANHAVGMKISILQGSPTGSPVYVEIQTPNTNSNGLISIEIGGQPGFDLIDWADGPYFIKTETDPDGGSNYTITGTSQLLSVPFALYARTAETVTGLPSETDPVFAVSASAGIIQADISAWNNKQDNLTAGTGIQIADNVISVVGGVNPGSSLPAVNTISYSDLSYRSTTVTGEVTDAGNEMVVARGFCYGTQSVPTFSNQYIQAGNGPGSFIGQLTSLIPNTTYYIRAFATNIVGTTYGNEISFTTLPLTIPSLTTSEISNISDNSAQGGGNITDDGGSDLTERGICWSLTTNPTISDFHSSDGNAAGTYVSLLTDLTPNTTYHVRAYATNAQGTGYGEEISFTTTTLSLASITTNVPTNISTTTATGGGNVTNDNGSAVTSRGICWATTSSPTTSDASYNEPGGIGSFTANITGLLPDTRYYVRAFAINGAGTVYGNEYDFTTLALTVPVISTKDISGISSNIAGSGGIITSDGGSPITSKGICWSLNPSPDLTNYSTTDGSGSDSYNSTMNNLNPLTTYYVRAYATNGLGTSYGNEKSFTTTDLVNPGPTVPVIGTSTSSITGSTTGSSGGYVSSDGGSPVTARGVCWGINPNPTLADNFSSDGDGLGFFTSSITGLSGCGIVYYIRAYATNSTGTGYGNQNSISTGLLPGVTTSDITDISYYTAVSGGSVFEDGGCSITQKGVCWSYNPNPTISNSKTTEGAGGGDFVSNISGLNANRTYYVRAYASNIKGTSYGPEKVFTTATPSTPYIGQNYAGGIVFYVDGTGEHGFVCSPENLGNFLWGCQGTSIPTGSALGTGATNTAAIVASCGETNTAAKICDNLVLNSYSDWFLPSTDELNLIYLNLYLQSLGGLHGGVYWSSTEADATRAYYHYFELNDIHPTDKNSYLNVRAVRAF